MRERDVESHFKDQMLQAQGRAYKWVSPGLRGVPDQIALKAIPPRHRAIVARYVRFVELKKPGEVPAGQQVLRHEELRDLGFRVDVLDCPSAVDEFMAAWL